ncbi:MAG: hypothetical protein H6Q73_2821 [Firmicutes bacterium]|nr:hypothetical protein [Bacillota bacterium]
MKLSKLAINVLVIFGLLGLNQVAAFAELPDNLLSLPEWEVTSGSYGGKLLLSDSPEMVSNDGIMYQDTVVGHARLFFHHVNATTTNKRVVAVLENSGEQAAKVTVYRSSLGGPGEDWIAVGKAAQTGYLGKSQLYVVTVPPHGVELLSSELGKVVVKPNMLVNGIYDFVSDRPVTVRTMMLSAGKSVESFVKKAKVLPADEQHLRGTFDGCDRLIISTKVYNPLKDGPVAVTLADNVIDKYVNGIDATDGSKVCNYGNYGIVYKLFLPATDTGKIVYYLNPRGGTYAGAMGIKYRHTSLLPVETPDGRLFMGQATERDYSVVGSFPAGESLWLTFSPPGASNLPVKLIIMPE